MPRFKITQIDKLLAKEMQTKNRFALVFPNFPDSNLYVKNVSISNASLSVEKIAGGTFYQGYEDAGEITMVFYSNTGFDVYDYFREWFEKFVFNSKKKQFRVIPKEQLPFKYRDALLQYTSKFLEFDLVPLKTWKLKGLMPLSISEPVFDEEDGDALTFTTTFAVQYIDDSIDGESRPPTGAEALFGINTSINNVGGGVQ